MKKIIPIILFSFLLVSNCFSQKYLGELAETEFNLSKDQLGFAVNLFEIKQQTIDFLDLKKSDVVAEIGAAEGINIGILSMLCDSVTFYAQDIDVKTLTQKHLDKTIAYYHKRDKRKQTNNFKLIIGTTNSTNLPMGVFDKIFIIDSFHDFDKRDEMLDDIYTKLKPNGKLTIIDGNSFIGDTLTCPDYGKHILPTMDAEIKMAKKHGFYVSKIRTPNFPAAHYANALVFEKNKVLSNEFYALKNAIDPLVKQSFRLKKKEIASDSALVKQIADSLLPKIKEITTVYKEYEIFIKDMAIYHLRKLNYQAAINIFKENIRFYPNSYQAFYWLGVAYQENKQYALALHYFNQSLALNSANANCVERIKVIKKKI